MFWKPIDLAPRDGTVILACARPQDGDNWSGRDIWAAPKAVSWRQYVGGRGVAKAAWRDAKGLLCAPTHYMMLPPAPAD